MLSERSLYRISFFLAIAGIVAVFLVSSGIEPQEIRISKITGDFLGRTVSVSGIIGDKPYWHEDGHLFFTLSDGPWEMKVVFFESAAKKLPGLKNLSKGMNVTVTGKVNEYKNELEIVGNEIGIR